MGHLLAEEEWRNSAHFRFSKVNLYPGSSSVGLSNFGMCFVVQLIVIKWQLSVTPKKLPDRGVFPFENGGKMWFFSIYHLSFLTQKHILF